MSILDEPTSIHADSAASPEQAFWEWFVAHEEMLLNVEEDPDTVCDAVFVALHSVDPALAFDMGGDRDGQWEFVVTASGNPAAFPAVVRLTQAAPALPSWTIRAFRPRRPMEGEFTMMCGTRVRLDEVRFTARPSVGRLDVRLFIPGYRRTPLDEFDEVGAMLVDMAVGEWDAETRLGTIHVGPPLPRVKSRPLAELPALVDRMTGN